MKSVADELRYLVTDHGEVVAAFKYEWDAWAFVELCGHPSMRVRIKR